MSWSREEYSQVLRPFVELHLSINDNPDLKH